MIISELILVSFGKFKNKKLQLQEGINIIYGNNEAGKTTIHKFIEGMFYGFFKPYTKRKVYGDDYDKYYPWYYNDYIGILKYKHEDRVYRIERNFLKGNEEVKVIDDKSGEDITHLFEYDKVKRLHEPSSLHLGLNNVVYNNTISIKQLGNKTEDDLAKEVKDSLINLGGSMDEDISVKRVIENLKKEINEIGTKTRIKTSPYGKIIDELQNLDRERQNALKVSKEIKENQERLNDIYEEITELNNRKRQIENSMTLVESYKAKDKYKKAVELIDEIKNIEAEINLLKRFKDVNADEYTDILKIENSIKTTQDTYSNLIEKENRVKQKLKKTIKGMEDYTGFDNIKDFTEVEQIVGDFVIMENRQKELLNITNRIQDIKNKIENSKTVDIINLNDDFCKYEELETEKNRLLYNRDYNNILFLKSRYEDKEKGMRKLNIYRGLSIMAVLSLFPLGIVVNPLLFLFLILPIGLSVYFTVALKEVKDYLNQLKSQIEEVEKKEGEVKEKIKNLEDEMTHILNKYNCLNKADFRKMINEFSKEASLLKDNDLLLKQLMSQKESLENEIGKYQSKIKKYFSLACIDGPIVFENVRLVKERYNKYLELRKTAIVIEDEIKEINKEIEEVKLKIERYQTETKSIFSRNNVKDIAEYEEAIYKKKRYDELVKSLTNNTNLLNSLLGDNNIEYLKKVGDRFNNEHIDSVKGLDVGTLEKELKEISSLIIDKSKEATRIEEKIRNLSSITRSLVSIEEDIIRKNRIKDKYEKKLDALELAIATIEKISKNIQRDFAPKLNKKVGNIISSITDGKYTEVKITENIDIKIIEPKNQRLIGIEELSGGTIDQMYFATRFGIIDIIKGDKNVPIILDDCFIQYDKKRLENILCFLKEEGAKRQIILFTCHTREREIFDKINIKYNYMEL